MIKKLKDVRCNDFKNCVDCPFWEIYCPYYNGSTKDYTMQEVKDYVQTKLDNIDLESEIEVDE